jgi:hypothetical protein
MSSFDITELIEETETQDQQHSAAYEKILSKIYFKVKMANKKKKYQILFQVPNMILGCSIYNIKACIAFVMLKLRQGGFNVKYVYPNILIIDWANIHTKTGKNVIKKKTNIKPLQRLYKNLEDSNITKHYSDLNKNIINNYDNGLINTTQDNDNEIDEHLSKLESMTQISKFY